MNRILLFVACFLLTPLSHTFDVENKSAHHTFTVYTFDDFEDAIAHMCAFVATKKLAVKGQSASGEDHNPLHVMSIKSHKKGKKYSYNPPIYPLYAFAQCGNKISALMTLEKHHTAMTLAIDHQNKISCAIG